MIKYVKNIEEVRDYLVSCERDFFNSYEWYSNFVANVIAVDKDQYRFICCFHDDKDWFSIVPVRLKKEKFGFSVTSLTNYYSPKYKILTNGLAPDRLDLVLECLDGLAPSWGKFTIDSLDEADCSELKKSVNFFKYPSSRLFHFANWYLPVLGRTYDEYFSELSPRVKNTVTRKYRAFEKLENAEIKIFKALDKVEAAINDFQAVYKNSWKRPEPYPEFIPGLIKLAAEQQALRLGIIYLRGVPIAAQLWFVADQTAYIFKLAYDEEYKKYSAGTILTASLMRHVIDIDKVEVVDFLSGDDEYKKEWMSCRRERFSICFYNFWSIYGAYMATLAFLRFFLSASGYIRRLCR